MSHMCRFCKQDHNRQRMFKYAARHWAHYDCWLQVKGTEVAKPEKYQGILELLQNGLHGWQLRNFPVFRLADWLEDHKTKDAPGRTWVDKACGILKRAIESAEKGQDGQKCPECNTTMNPVFYNGNNLWRCPKWKALHTGNSVFFKGYL